MTKYVLFISIYLVFICECTSFTLTSVANYRNFTTVFFLGDNHPLLLLGCSTICSTCQADSLYILDGLADKFGPLAVERDHMAAELDHLY